MIMPMYSLQMITETNKEGKCKKNTDYYYKNKYNNKINTNNNKIKNQKRQMKCT